MVQKNLQQSLTAFIPKNLDLDKMLNENPPNFIYHKDNFVYLIDLIYQLFNQERLDEFGDIYSRPHSALMQRRVRNYREHLDYLIENKVFFEDKQYIVNKQSRGFAFSFPYDSEAKEVQITNTKLIKKILKFYHIEKSKPIIKTEDINISYLLKWLEDGKLKIDFRQAKAYLRKLYMKERNTPVNLTENQSGIDEQEFLSYSAMQKYNSRLRPLILFHKGTFNAKLDSTAGRLHSVLTQLKGNLRQFINYDNQQLVAIDIVNSQPYLASVLLNSETFNNNDILNLIKLYNPNYVQSNKNSSELLKLITKIENEPDTKNYINAVKEGHFYEEFGKLLNMETFDRKQVKEATFCSIFSPNQLASHLKEIEFFNSAFPNVFKVFKKIKQGKGTHNTLACTLQNFEANLILHNICKEISQINPNIPLLTLHDSIITIPQHKDFVEHKMIEKLTNAVGFPPVLKQEKWERVA